MMNGQFGLERCFSRFYFVRFLFKMHDFVPCRCKINLEKYRFCLKVDEPEDPGSVAVSGSFSIKGAIKLIIACAHPFFNDFCKIPQKNCKYFSCVQEGKKGKKEKRLTAQAAEPAARARSSALNREPSVLYQFGARSN